MYLRNIPLNENAQLTKSVDLIKQLQFRQQTMFQTGRSMQTKNALQFFYFIYEKKKLVECYQFRTSQNIAHAINRKVKIYQEFRKCDSIDRAQA